jgi:hypothetical protein
VLLLILIQTKGRINFKSIDWRTYFEYVLYSFMSTQFWTNEINCLERKWVQSIVSKNKVKFSDAIREKKFFSAKKSFIFQLSWNQREDLTESIVQKVLDKFFPVGKR